MSLVKWSRPEITVASTVDKRVHVSERITWRDVLTVVGRFEMELRRKHAELRATDRRALNGTIKIRMHVDRSGTSTVLAASSEADVTDLQPHVASCMERAKFPASGIEMEIRIECVFDSDSIGEKWTASSDPFAEPDDDPFASSYAAEVPRDDPGFGDPF